MKLEKIEIGKLNPAKYNPRVDLKTGDPEYEKLKTSFKEFGYLEPIIWNKKTGNILSGHQRFKILSESAPKEIDCIVVELDETKEKVANIALNKVQGDWDNEKLTALISDLKGVDFDISLTGFDEKELEKMFKNYGDDILGKNSEIEAENFSDENLGNLCPKCGFRWSDG